MKGTTVFEEQPWLHWVCLKPKTLFVNKYLIIQLYNLKVTTIYCVEVQTILSVGACIFIFVVPQHDQDKYLYYQKVGIVEWFCESEN